MKKYKWAKQKEEIREVIEASYDPIREWQQDKKGYFLIRVNPEKKQIEVGFVSKDNSAREGRSGWVVRAWSAWSLSVIFHVVGDFCHD